MSNPVLSRDLQMREFMASGIFIGKFVSLMVSLVIVAVNGVIAAAIFFVMLAAWCAADKRVHVSDPGFWGWMAAGIAAWLTGTLFLPFAVLFGTYLYHSVHERHFAHAYACVPGLDVLRTQLTINWLVVMALCALSGILFGTGAAAWGIVLAVLSGGVVQAYLQLYSRGPVWRAVTERRLGDFVFRRVAAEDAQLEPVYKLFFHEMEASLSEGGVLENRSLDDLALAKMQQDRPNWASIAFFAAYHDGRLVGTMAAQLDYPGRRLPIEVCQSQTLNLDALRNVGGLVEFGKLSVLEEYRLNPEVLGGLLLCATEFAFVNNRPFVVLQSVMKSAKIYGKMGFATLSEEPGIQHEYKCKLQLFARNLAVDNQTPNRLSGNISEVLSPYIISRFIWVQILAVIVGRITGRRSPADVPTDQLQMLGGAP